MDPDKITLDCLSKIFEYERISRELDTCENIEQVKNIAKSIKKILILLNFKYFQDFRS
jgi:hypothetical protein